MLFAKTQTLFAYDLKLLNLKIQKSCQNQASMKASG